MSYFKVFSKYAKMDCHFLRRLLFLCSIPLFLVSCGIIEIKGPTPKVKDIFYGDFVENYQKAPNLFIEFDGNDCNRVKRDTPMVYLTSGQQLRDCMANDRISLIYAWSIGCSNQRCISPELTQSFCDKYEVPLYVLALTYNVKALSQRYNIERPIYAINTKYYGTELQRKYKRLFYRDLIDQKSSLPGLFLMFRQGKYIDYFNSIDEFDAYMEYISEFK